jgi:hypothetical protein
MSEAERTLFMQCACKHCTREAMGPVQAKQWLYSNLPDYCLDCAMFRCDAYPGEAHALGYL